MKKIDTVYPSLTYILLKDGGCWKVCKKIGLLAGGSEEYAVDTSRQVFTTFIDAICIVNNLNVGDDNNNKELHTK